MPPGTGDVQLTLTQTAPLTGAVIVTTPQDVALIDARKGLEMFRQVRVPVCRHRREHEHPRVHELRPRGAHLRRGWCCAGCAPEYDVPFLGGLPLDIRIREQADSGRPTVVAEPDGAIAQIYKEIARKVAISVAQKAADFSAKFPSIVIQKDT